MNRLFITLILLLGAYEAAASYRALRLAMRATRPAWVTTEHVELKPGITGAQSPLGSTPDRSQAGRPQQDDGPWNGNFVGWVKRGHVLSRTVKGGRSSLGGLKPVPGEEWREVRWTGGEETTIMVKIKGGRTHILRGQVKAEAPVKPPVVIPPIPPILYRPVPPVVNPPIAVGPKWNINNLYQSWIHSREDQGGNTVDQIFRPPNFKEFPRSMYRMSVVFHENRIFGVLRLAPDCRHYMEYGSWRVDPNEHDIIHIVTKSEGNYSFKILELKKNLFRIAHIR